MALRGKNHKKFKKDWKLYCIGNAGVGKTTAMKLLKEWGY